MDDRLWGAPDNPILYQAGAGNRPDGSLSAVPWKLGVRLRSIMIVLAGLSFLLILGLCISPSSQAENAPPSATIEHVNPEKAYDTQAISFAGRGDDPDGNITAWWWLSDRDGNLSEIDRFELSGLSVGNHTITFQVRDDQGAWSNKATQDLTVQANHLPYATQANLSRISVFREENLTIFASGEDEETDLADMAPQLEYRSPYPGYEGWSTHTGDIFSTAISKDGERIAVGSLDRRIICFSRDSATPLWSYPVGAFPEVAISADGQYIAGKSWDRRVHLFHYRNPTPLWSYHAGEHLYAVDISDDGKYIAAASATGKIHFFNRGSSTPLWSYSTQDRVDRIALSANGEYLAVASWDHHIYLFHRDSDQPMWNYTTEGRADGVDISADGEYIAAGSDDQRVYLFHRDSNEPLWSYTAQGGVDSVALSQDGRYLAAGSDDDHVYFFHREHGEPLWSYPTLGNVESVAISQDGTVIAAGSNDNSIYLFHRDSSQPLWTKATGGDIHMVSLSASGEDVVGGSYDSHTHFYSRWGNLGVTDIHYQDDQWKLNLSFAPTAVPGMYEHRLRFKDGQGGVGPWNLLNQTSIVVNRAPTATIDSITPEPLHSTQLVTFTGTGLDHDGEYLISGYHWESDLDGYLEGNASFTRKGLSPGEHTIIFRVQDSDGDWSENATTLLTVEVNQVPTIDSLDTSSWQIHRGGHLQLLLNASDDQDQEAYLDFHVEHLEQEWAPMDPHESHFRDGYWRLCFDFAIDHLLGPFPLRIRAVDSHEGQGQWHSPDIEVSIVNNRPTAFIDSIVPYRSNFTELVTFKGHGEDVDGTITSYRWHSSTNGILSDQANFSTMTLTPGVHTIHLFVLDSDGEWSSDDTVTFRVNAPPTSHIETLEPQLFTLGTVVNLSGYGEDPDGIIVGHRWWASWSPDNLSLEPSFKLVEIPYGIHTLFFSVQDNRGIWSLPDTALLHVNARPSAHILESTSTFVHSGETVTLASTSGDLDGYIVEERWTSSMNGVLDLSGGPLDYLQPGQHTLSLRARDDFGAWSLPVEWPLRVNDRPRIEVSSIRPQVVEQGEEVVFTINATDTDGQLDLYRLSFEPSSQGPILYFEFSPQEQWTLDTATFQQGDHTVHLTVCDNDGGCSSTFSSWLYLNIPPVAMTGALELTPSREDRDLVVLSAGGLDDEALVAYQWRSDLDGLVGHTGEPRIELENLTPATHRLSVRVQDAHGLWSAWVAWEEPVTITSPEEPEPEIIRLLREQAPMMLVALVGLLTISGIGVRRRRNRVYRTQVVEPLARLRQLAQMHEEAHLTYPRERFDRVVSELSMGRYRGVLADSVSLAKQMSETLELYGTARQMLDSTHQLNHLVALTERTPAEPASENDLEDQMNEALEQFDEAKELLRKARELAASAQLDQDELMDWEERNN